MHFSEVSEYFHWTENVWTQAFDFLDQEKYLVPFPPQENRAKGPRLSRGLQGRQNPAPHPVPAAPDAPSLDAHPAATPWTATSLSFTAGLAFQKPNPMDF
ncbi:unnamed protein product [Rangifer tarandus platyrhynchus]|uniref:Uncharacterized protein n=1 Tax=Rangifer tarandus platyrhynchus TaxID=3082113 RepID=A0AC59Y813_RANTA